MSWSGPAAAPPPVRRRRRHPFVTLFVVLVVLLGLLVVADRVGVRIAEGITASRLQSSQKLTQKPDVDVAGFPFLTQLAAGHYDKITVTAHDLEVGDSGHQARLTTLTTVLRDVHTSDNFHHVHAATLTATGSTTLAQIGQATGLTLTAAGDGRVSTTKKVTALGQTVSVTVSSKPVVRGGRLAFDSPRLENAGSLAGAVSQSLASLFDISVALDNVPFHLRPTSVAVAGSTVRFALDGSDVDLAG